MEFPLENAGFTGLFCLKNLWRNFEAFDSLSYFRVTSMVFLQPLSVHRLLVFPSHLGWALHFDMW